MSPKKIFPDFVIVGAMKSATSSVRNFLSQHPDIIILDHEGNFFNREENYRKGLSWYRIQFLDKSPLGRELWGEKTVDYSYLSYVPERIYQVNPAVKLVWVFRNPVDRTYSNYLHELRRGREYLSFNNALKQESRRILSNPLLGYVKRSVYYEQVSRYLRFFPTDNMHFMLFEELVKDPGKVLSELLAFLDIDKNHDIRYTSANETARIPRVPKLLYFANKYLKETSFFFKFINTINFTMKKEGYPKMDRSLRDQLRLFFIPYNRKLQILINKNLSIWD